MKKSAFQVKWLEQWNSRGEWADESAVVLAVDAEAAIKRAKGHAIGNTWTDEQSGKVYKTTGFRLVSVEHVVTIDIG
jgi:hypothetical protein